MRERSSAASSAAGCDAAGRGLRDPRRARSSAFVHGRRLLWPSDGTSELDYELPEELIAQHPAERRDASRLLVYGRATGEVRHREFADLPGELSASWPSSTTRGSSRRASGLEQPARRRCCSSSGSGATAWGGSRGRRAGCAPGGRLRPVELLEPLGEGRWRLRLDGEPAGEAPLPPYITEPLADPARYQTVYADEAGSAAAPTAGLHFTPELLARIDVERVTLHVGLDTFRPLATETLEEHELHGERYSVRPEAWERIRAADAGARGRHDDGARARDGRRGRARSPGRTASSSRPGFEFRRVDALLTNFHLPRSTLLALVMAFAGVEETRRLYRLAVEERYRFYSFGDAMLVL